ncbi:MAG: YiiX/YebB-like N1pC/P60 family cysteine hydrolase [Bacteroidales bacterium]
MVDRHTIQIIVLVSILFFNSCYKESDISCDSILNNQDKMQFQNGDLILRRGKGFVSQFIVDQLNDSTNLSHIGVLVKENDSLMIIHCIGNEFSNIEGIQICSLDEFLTDCYSDGILVVRSNICKGSQVSTLAKEYLHMSLPFDRKFDFSDASAFSCLELPYNIFKRLNVAYLDMVSFKPFQDSLRFDIILDKRNL